MTRPFVIAGQVPADSPATALAGRTVAIPVGIGDLEQRLVEFADAGAEPVILPAGPWTRLALGLTGGTVAGVLAAVAGVAGGSSSATWGGVGIAALCGGVLFPAVSRAEVEQ